jgi:hypothetical protein
MGLFVALHQLAVGVAAGNAAEAQGFLLLPLTDMIIFPIFFGAAVYYRRSPAGPAGSGARGLTVTTELPN